MARRSLVALFAGGMALVLTPVMAGAAPLTASDYGKPVEFFRFCAEAQLDIANVDEDAMAAADITIGGTVYEDFNDFVASKSAVSIDDRRILTGTWMDHVDSSRSLLKAYRCKLRTGESLTKGAWPNGAANNAGRFAVDPYYGFGASAAGVSTDVVDQKCTTINQRTIDNVWSNLTTQEKADAPYAPTGGSPTLTTVPDREVFAGSEWTQPTEPVKVTGGVLEVESLSLIAETTNTEGLPRFLGAHYCTLVAPEYLHAVLVGDVTVA